MPRDCVSFFSWPCSSGSPPSDGFGEARLPLSTLSEFPEPPLLEASVVAALERIRNEQEKYPDQCVALERELSLIQTRLHHLVETIANGKSTDSVIASLHQEEARKKVVAQELSRLDSLAQVVSLDAKRLAKNLRSRLGDIPALFSRHVSLARQMLRKLLDEHILCEPIMEGGRAGYRFTATGTFDRLLTGFKVVNESGGGQGSLDLFCLTIRVSLQARPAEAQRANAKR